MKRCMTWMLAGCLGLTIIYPTQAQDVLGGASAAVRGTSSSTSRAAVRVPARAGAAAAARTTTQAGANFDAANLRVNAAAGANANQRTGAGGNGLRAGASTRSSVNADIRLRQARQTSRNRQSSPEHGRATETRQSGNASLAGASNVAGLVRSGVDVRFNQRLAEVDRMRDTAVARGDFALLQRADLAEQQLRAEHARQVQANAQAELGNK